MATNYANDRLTAAIRSHLLSVDVLPPTAEISRLAGELAQVCLNELSSAGLSAEAVEKLFVPAAFKARARGIN